MKVKLKKKKVVGNRAFHYFDNSGTEIRIPCSFEEYHALGLKDAGPAIHPDGFKWLRSSIEPEYNTPDGDLEDDSYAVLTDTVGYSVVKITGKDTFTVGSGEILNDEIEVIYGSSI